MLSNGLILKIIRLRGPIKKLLHHHIHIIISMFEWLFSYKSFVLNFNSKKERKHRDKSTENGGEKPKKENSQEKKDQDDKEKSRERERDPDNSKNKDKETRRYKDERRRGGTDLVVVLRGEREKEDDKKVRTANRNYELENVYV